MVGNDGPMGLWRIWTISHGHLDHSRDCRRSRYRLAPTIGFLVMCWRPLTLDPPLKTDRSPRIKARCWRMGRKVPQNENRSRGRRGAGILLRFSVTPPHGR